MPEYPLPKSSFYPTLDVGRCRSCGAAVLWLTYHKPTKEGQPPKRAPIDATPDPEQGNIEVLEKHGQYRVLGKRERDVYRGRAHTNHFMTCPDRVGWAKQGSTVRP